MQRRGKATSICRRRSRPPFAPGRLGGLYEIRIYTFKPGGVAGVIDRWSGYIARRSETSP
jgi:hypothetical protein